MKKFTSTVRKCLGSFVKNLKFLGDRFLLKPRQINQTLENIKAFGKKLFWLAFSSETFFPSFGFPFLFLFIQFSYTIFFSAMIKVILITLATLQFFSFLYNLARDYFESDLFALQFAFGGSLIFCYALISIFN